MIGLYRHIDDTMYWCCWSEASCVCVTFCQTPNESHIVMLSDIIDLMKDSAVNRSIQSIDQIHNLIYDLSMEQWKLTCVHIPSSSVWRDCLRIGRFECVDTLVRSVRCIDDTPNVRSPANVFVHRTHTFRIVPTLCPSCVTYEYICPNIRYVLHVC